MQIQTNTFEVVTTTTEEVRGIFITETEINRLSYPLFKLVQVVERDAAQEYSSLTDAEGQAVRDLKALVDEFRNS